MAIQRKYRLRGIEDCAHAIETRSHGKPVGTFGDAGCFSFYVTKNVLTAEGGMVVTANHAMDEKIKILALHGLYKDAWKRFSDSGYKHYTVTQLGFKYNMTDLQASLGIHQLKRVESNWKRRKFLWDRYMAGLQGLPTQLPEDPEPQTRHAF